MLLSRLERLWHELGQEQWQRKTQWVSATRVLHDAWRFCFYDWLCAVNLWNLSKVFVCTTELSKLPDQALLDMFSASHHKHFSTVTSLVLQTALSQLSSWSGP